MRISDWSSDVCSSDLCDARPAALAALGDAQLRDGGGIAALSYRRLPQHRRPARAGPPQRLAKLAGTARFSLRKPRRDATADRLHLWLYAPRFSSLAARRPGAGRAHAGAADAPGGQRGGSGSDEHTSDLTPLRRLSY